MAKYTASNINSKPSQTIHYSAQVDVFLDEHVRPMLDKYDSAAAHDDLTI